ncbi:cation diffusion facilitator family transporter [Natrialbaceae archaeon AArc-T1-2]|uniref:cation diffusion facilitator family transporter n=1 Tax=Natrialbaceae archaeon AArc-T1-2 TaxID=3053904 RepID=UPI00255AE54C|nr:cation diffusion facilitator family transporter [Natrialbaceae archaeon AArc-T1-2]WIV66060.1 cation diffusion facilitator family transporter [Natrialbaceae archaeon AArc-T1-2]
MTTNDDRRRFGRASWANVVGNAAKIVVEGGAGIAFGSVALVADAAHSVADLVASVVVLVWGDTRFRDPDVSHPHGHARIEPLTALFVGALIVLLGLNLFWESITGLLYGPEGTFSYLLIGALGFAIADMYLVYRYTVRVNDDLDSTALAALAKDCLNDLYTTVGALVGVVGLALGYPSLDPIAGGLVSLLVVYQGLAICRENTSYVVGSAAPAERREQIRRRLMAHPEVEGVHDLVVFHDGTVLEVEAHVEVPGDRTLREAHDVESELVSRVGSLEDVGDVHVHLDPSGIGEWKDASERGRGDSDLA